jgi:nitroreductase
MATALDDPDHFTALTSRYADQPRPAHIRWNGTISGQLAHRSVRAFLPDAVPDGTIEMLVAAAQSAPSSSNTHLWSVIAVTDLALRSRLGVLARNQRDIEEASLFLLWVADLARATEIGRREDTLTEASDYLETFLTAVADTALAAQNAAVAAESLGLGTVFIGALRNHPEEVAELVGLPPRCFVTFGLVVGHPDPARPAAVKPRPAPEIVLHRDRYSGVASPDAIARFDAVSHAFQEEQRLPTTGWVAPLLARLGNAASLSGRDRLREALGRLGFPLL